MAVLWDVPVRYVNSANETITLQGNGLGYLDIAPLYSYAWTYDMANSVTGDGGEAAGFVRRPRTIELELRNRGMSRAEFIARMDALHAAAEVDAINSTPGRLWLADQYMDCFLAVAGGVENAPRNGSFATTTITVLAVRPYWCTERVTEYYPVVTTEDPEDHGKKYNLKYDYRYGTGLADNTINNMFYASCPAIITIYGPAAGPALTIDGNVYGISTAITATERLVIDGTRREIYAVGAGGTRVNLFNSRIKTGDAFQPIAPGTHRVISNGNYRMQFKLIEERSQPRWIE